MLTVAVFVGKVPLDSIHAFNMHMRAVSGKAVPSLYLAQSAKAAGYAGCRTFRCTGRCSS